MTREQVNDPALLEGDRVTVTLTGKVVGRGTRFLTIKFDGQEDTTFGAEDLVYIWRENDSVTVEKHEPLADWERELLYGDPRADEEIRPGDRDYSAEKVTNGE